MRLNFQSNWNNTITSKSNCNNAVEFKLNWKTMRLSLNQTYFSNAVDLKPIWNNVVKKTMRLNSYQTGKMRLNLNQIENNAVKFKSN